MPCSQYPYAGSIVRLYVCVGVRVTLVIQIMTLVTSKIRAKNKGHLHTSSITIISIISPLPDQPDPFLGRWSSNGNQIELKIYENDISPVSTRSSRSTAAVAIAVFDVLWCVHTK